MPAGLDIAWPYSLGLVAAFNPCGFALLPAYLSYFLGIETAGTATGAPPGRGTALMAPVARGIAVALTMTAGFVSVFGLAGVVFSTILNQGAVLDRIGYATIAVGIAMVGLSIPMLSGRGLRLGFLKLSSGLGGRGLVSVFVFGVGYATASLSCSVGLFIVGVSKVFTDQGFVEGVITFAAYGLGMGAAITFLTLSLVLAGDRVARAVRGARRWVDPVSGLTLAAAGVYLVNYGWLELRGISDPTARNMLVDWFTALQADVSGWIASATPFRLGVVCTFGVAGALLLGWAQQTSRTQRVAAGSVYAAAWLVVEFGFTGGELVLGPAWRFAAGWPGRAAGWFTDPLRLGVVGEVALTALTLWTAVRLAPRMLSRMPRSTGPGSDPELERGQGYHVNADRQDEAGDEQPGEKPAVEAQMHEPGGHQVELHNHHHQQRGH